jgi:uncharacterized phage protein (predicted DNA packaging)
MLDDIKVMLRISSSNTVYDVEINDLIEAARHDLMLSGVSSEKVNDDTDPLIKRAISTFTKANFGWDNPDSERLQNSYSMLKQHLTLSQKYSLFTVTFIVDNGEGVLLEDATITFNGEKRITNSSGVATFIGVKETQNMEYTVSKDGYETIQETVDVEESLSISVSLAVV